VAVEMSRPHIEAAHHKLSLTFPDEPTDLVADPARLAQVFANLLNNAAKYTERGGQINLEVHREGNDAVITVRDSGIGIPSHLLPKLFEMFTQIDRSLERSRGGLGIGLSLVKRLVEMHGGTVQARSEGHGLGSEFIVRIPVVLSLAQIGQNAESDRPSGAVPRHRILVVDDNHDSATSLALMLKLMGNIATTAHDGLEALAVAAVFRPDVILLDIGMPKLNGYDTARRIREQAWGKNPKLIALTGWGQEEDRRRSQEAGFDDHLTKPVDPATLETLLANLLADSA
jgi:CheY-like chemotaxis protein